MTDDTLALEAPALEAPAVDYLELLGLNEPQATAPTVSAPTTERRWFLRCNECLEPFAVMLPKATKSFYTTGTVCPYCGAESIKTLGRVKAGIVWRYEDQTPCDDRCTYARGPNCDCQCHGDNHGSRVTVSVAIANGSLRVLATEEQQARNAGKRAARLAELQEVTAQATAAVESRFAHARDAIEDKQNGRWVRDGMYGTVCDYYRAHRELAKARAGATHAGRIKALRYIAERYAGADYRGVNHA